MRIFSLILAAAILVYPVQLQVKLPSEPPLDFKGDGCTLFPDGNFRECCHRHDLDYFRGGTASQRRQSDLRLYRCVRDAKGWQNEVAAPLMYLGVRIFGTAYLPTPFRWGFGQKKKKE